ncbi:MSCRAMM family protein [Plantibacter sp. YIM 135347]|uniref:MSCRAMM family protein n=1 Tax=Plantibacter sp. YIM 135347 TaxID=3423919 RepID=UPI003D35541E
MRRRLAITSLALLAAAATVFTGAIPASAATTGTWASWTDLVGTSGAFTGSMTLAGQPALTATIKTDSRSGQIGVISGASTWLSQGTPVGAKYGSSVGKPYLNLRPKADTAVAPSTTTYSFATPTPPSGWTFVLGDIDADKVQVKAIGPDGIPLTAAELGYQSSFNYCAPGVAGKPPCPGAADDVPAWDPATQTLTGNAAALDTSGAAAWFEPSTEISSLSFVFTRRSGFPIYQTWFASLARDISGVVSDQNTGPLDGVDVRLVDRNGTVVSTTTTAAGGAYSFPGFIATDGYIVETVVPAGKIAVGASRAPADLTTADAVVDFTVRDIIPVPVSGTVKDSSGTPIAGAVVTIPGLDPVTTDSAGNYLFDAVAVGDHVVTVTPPPGYTTPVDTLPFTVPVDSETPITGQDFTLVPNPTLSGTVVAGGAGVAGVTVVVTGSGDPISAVTGSDGSYSFPRLPAGDYTVTVLTPSGYVIVGPESRDETVAAANVTGVDFELGQEGSFGGVVVAGDDPVPGATITVSTDEGPTTITTDPDGGYSLGALPPGTYTLTLTVPDGYTAGGPLDRTVEIDGSGAAVTVDPFILVADAVIPTPTPTPTPSPTATDVATVAPHAGQLSSTGVTPILWVAGGIALVAILAGAGIVIGRRIRNRS